MRQKQKRLRREIRELSQSEWSAVVDAFWVIKFFILCSLKNTANIYPSIECGLDYEVNYSLSWPGKVWN